MRLFVSTFFFIPRPALFPPVLLPGPDAVQAEGALLIPEIAIRPEEGVAVGVGDARPPADCGTGDRVSFL